VTQGAIRPVQARRAQIALEFAMMVMLAFIFLTVILVIVGYHVERAQKERRIAALQDEARTIQEELLLAASVPDGYERNLTLPERLDGEQYTVTNSEQTLTLTLEETILNEEIPPVSGTFVKGANTIRKRDGIISIT